MENKCEHEYKEVVTKVQEPVIKHWEYKDHLLTTLIQEKITLFCIKCGDVKEIKNEKSYN